MKDDIFLEVAKSVSKFSKDPRRKIGAIAVDRDNRILSTGYNGFPRGTFDTESDWNNRELKDAFVIHAEANMIYNATYTGVGLKDATVYVHGLPVCEKCAIALIQAGVSKIIYYHDFIEGDERWESSFIKTKEILNLAGVKIEKAN